MESGCMPRISGRPKVHKTPLANDIRGRSVKEMDKSAGRISPLWANENLLTEGAPFPLPFIDP
jgi:hypothetical protein